MASPGQRRGSYGHVMAGFDGHEKCACCRDKKLGKDLCVTGNNCIICDNFTDMQRSMLATPQYQICKDKKSGVLVCPSIVTVIGLVGMLDEDSVPQDSAHGQEQAGSSSSTVPLSQQPNRDFVSRQVFDILNNQLEEKSARFETLLTRSNIFSTPKLPVAVANPPVSDTPFINPSDPRATGPVQPPGQDIETCKDKKDKGVGKSKQSSKPAAAGSSGLTSTSPSDFTSTLKMDVPGLGLKSLDRSDTVTSAR